MFGNGAVAIVQGFHDWAWKGDKKSARQRFKDAKKNRWDSAMSELNDE